MNQRRILIVTPLYPPDTGGPATYSKLLHEELAQWGINSSVLSFGSVKHLPYLIRHIVFFFKCLKSAKDVDFVYAQDPLGTGLPSAFATRIRKKKFYLKIVGDRAWEKGQQDYNVKESLDTYSKKTLTHPVLMIAKWGQKLTAKMAYKIIVPSEYLKKVVSNWDVEQDKIAVIYNSFTLSELGITKEKARKELKLQGKVILSAGRLVKWKGFLKLVKVISNLSESYKDIRLVIAGDGPDHEKIESYISKNDLEDYIWLVGRLDREILMKYIKASDLFVLNTGYEGLSHQILEVMSQGTPVLTSNIGGNPELIDDKKSGLLFEYNNSEDIKECIFYALENYKEMEKMAEKAKEKVSDFTKEKMLSKLTKQFI